MSTNVNGEINVDNNKISFLNDDEVSLALHIHDEITVKEGKRRGFLYKTSKKAWRNESDMKMASIYYVWRTVAFRTGQDVQLPLHSTRYIEPTLDDTTMERLNKVVAYIGVKFFSSTYLR